MHRYQLRFAAGPDETPGTLSLDVPDITTALVVADINAAGGSAEIWDGDHKLAALSRQSDGPRPLWQVG
jgi:hypothetical protein